MNEQGAKKVLRIFALTLFFSYFVLFGIEYGFGRALLGFVLSFIGSIGVVYLVWIVYRST